MGIPHPSRLTSPSRRLNSRRNPSRSRAFHWTAGCKGSAFDIIIARTSQSNRESRFFSFAEWSGRRRNSRQWREWGE